MESTEAKIKRTEHSRRGGDHKHCIIDPPAGDCEFTMEKPDDIPR